MGAPRSIQCERLSIYRSNMALLKCRLIASTFVIGALVHCTAYCWGSDKPQSLLQKAERLMGANRPDGAELAISDAMKIANQNDDKMNIADATYHYGLLYKNDVLKQIGRENYSLSIDYFLKSAALFKKINMYSGVAKSYEGAAEAASMSGKKALACKYYRYAKSNYYKYKKSNNPNDPGFVVLANGWDFISIVKYFEKQNHCN